MSLEAAITDLTTAVKELIGVTTNLTNMRSEAIEKVGSALQNVAGAKGKEKDTKSKEESKAKDEPKQDTASDPYDGVKDLIAKYVTGTDREEERTARKAKVKALLSHEKIKKPDVAEPSAVDHIMESAVGLFKDQINKLIDKGDLTEPKSDDLDL